MFGSNTANSAPGSANQFQTPAISTTSNFFGATPATSRPTFTFGGAPASAGPSNLSINTSGPMSSSSAPSALPAASTQPFSLSNSLLQTPAITYTPAPSNTFASNFGANTNPAANIPTNATSQPQSNFGFGGFGSAPSNMASNPPQTQPLFGGFGMNQASTVPQGTSSFFGKPPLGMTQPTSQFSILPSDQRLQPSVGDLLNAMINSWDPKSPQCQFKHYFYNMVHPSEVSRYGKPADQDDRLWLQALSDSPDPSCMVPALATGFEDIKKRIEQQERQSSVHQEKLKEMNDTLDAIQRKHQVETLSKISEYKRRQLDLSHRVLQLMRKVQFLKNRGFTIKPFERDLHYHLDKLEMNILKPANSHGRLCEIWATIQRMKESRLKDPYKKTLTGYLSLESDSTDNMKVILSEHQKGISCLIGLLKKDMEDVNTMIHGYAVKSSLQ